MRQSGSEVVKVFDFLGKYLPVKVAENAFAEDRHSTTHRAGYAVAVRGSVLSCNHQTFPREDVFGKTRRQRRVRCAVAEPLQGIEKTRLKWILRHRLQ